MPMTIFIRNVGAKVMLPLLALTIFTAIQHTALAANIGYIHGDVAADGTVPSGAAEPYDQMLLTDTGNTGLSMFKTLVESQGHLISQHYDQQTTLSEEFLCGKDVLVFGLHQKLWSEPEKIALDNWLREGGGLFIYSDSASGGSFRDVGAQNTVGQSVTNNLIAQYGMQVTVDQADGTTFSTAFDDASIDALQGLELEGEGVSPVAVSPTSSTVEILVPYTRDVNKQQNITIQNPVFAALALRPIASGHAAVMFDRQPMWNNGPGSDIEKRDNTEILRVMINTLAAAPSPRQADRCTGDGTTDDNPTSDDLCVSIKAKNGAFSLVCL